MPVRYVEVNPEEYGNAYKKRYQHGAEEPFRVHTGLCNKLESLNRMRHGMGSVSPVEEKTPGWITPGRSRRIYVNYTHRGTCVKLLKPIDLLLATTQKPEEPNLFRILFRDFFAFCAHLSELQNALIADNKKAIRLSLMGI